MKMQLIILIVTFIEECALNHLAERKFLECFLQMNPVKTNGIQLKMLQKVLEQQYLQLEIILRHASGWT